MPVSNLIGKGNNDPLLSNKITANDFNPTTNLLDQQIDNKLTELAYTGSGSLSKQATMKRAKSAISRSGKYRNKFKSSIAASSGTNKHSFGKNSYDDTGESNDNDDELNNGGNKSPNSLNFVQEEFENEHQKDDLDKNDINLFDKQAVPGLSAVSLR